MHRSGKHRAETMLRIIKGDIRHLPAEIKMTIISISIYNLGWGFADPFFSVYLKLFSDSYAVIGFFVTLATITGALILIPLGDLLDRVRHSRLINSAKIIYFFIAVAYFAAGYFQSIPLLVSALLVNGAMGALVWSGTSATLRDFADKKDSAITFGLYTTARQFTWIMGLGIALLVVTKLPIYYIFIPVMILAPLSIIFSRGRKAKHHQLVRKAVKALVIEDKILGRFFREIQTFNKEMWVIFFFFFTAAAIPIFATYFIPLFAIANGFSLFQIGVLVVVMNLPYLFSFIAAEVADHSERLRNLIIGLGISAIAVAALSFWNTASWHLYLLGFFFMTGYAILIPSVSGIATMLIPKKYNGTGTAMIDLLIFSAVVLLAPLFGLLIDAIGWEQTFIVVSGVLGVLMVLAYIVQMVFRRQNLMYTINHPDTNHEPYIL